MSRTGKVVTLTSRDCCPYLGDYEPDYFNPAVAAVTPTEVRSVSWDPSIPDKAPKDVVMSQDRLICRKETTYAWPSSQDEDAKPRARRDSPCRPGLSSAHDSDLSSGSEREKFRNKPRKSRRGRSQVVTSQDAPGAYSLKTLTSGPEFRDLIPGR